MKKKIYPAGILYIATMILFSLIVLSCLYVAIYCVYKLLIYKIYILIIPGLAALYSVILFSYTILCNIPNKIILNDEAIYVTGQKIKGKIQHRGVINFSEIKDIKLIYTHTDSKGQKLKRDGVAVSMRAYFFLEFLLKNGLSKRIYIEIYSIRQRKQLLRIINEKANLDFSYDQLERKDDSMFKRTNKQ